MLFTCSSFMGYQGAESDSEKLQLSEHLFAAVLAEARMCCAGQPVILAGDFNADPTVIPSLAKGISDGQWIDLERAFATGRGVAPSRTCHFQLDEDKDSRRDFLLACPIALAAATACSVLPDRWFTPHFAVYAEFALSAWDATVDRARVYSPLWPACWLDCPDRSRRSPSHAVQNIWDVYIQEVGFVPREVWVQFLIAVEASSPYAPCDWEVGVAIVSIVLIVPMSLMSLFLAFSSTRLLPPCFAFGVGLFLSVMSLKGLSYMGFQRPGLLLYVIVGVPLFVWALLAPVTSLEPWTHWIPPDLHGFYKCAMDTLALLNEFVLKVVRHR